VPAPDQAGPAAGTGSARSPYAFDVGFQDLVARGERHEKSVLGQFRADGRAITEIAGGLDASAAMATLELSALART